MDECFSKVGISLRLRYGKENLGTPGMTWKVVEIPRSYGPTWGTLKKNGQNGTLTEPALRFWGGDGGSLDFNSTSPDFTHSKQSKV